MRKDAFLPRYLFSSDARVDCCWRAATLRFRLALCFENPDPRSTRFLMSSRCQQTGVSHDYPALQVN